MTMSPHCPFHVIIWGVFLCILTKESQPVSWEEWWTYDGISGPGFWGLINPEWSLCHKGRRQSPVNLEPERLLFDRNLQLLHIDKHGIRGSLSNTGHGVVFSVDNGTQHPVNISGGPLSYRYQFCEIHLHYGLNDQRGSEHTVDNYAFPAEIQIFGFNSELYNNYSDALHRPQGTVAISLLLQVGDLSNPELRKFTDKLNDVKYRGEMTEIPRFVVRELLPDTKYYMTYEGSITMPACHETTTWIILNKPIYITKQQGTKNCPTMHRDISYKAHTWE
ncbi:carbonic anhydrase-related protein 10 isoform X2 [Chelonus insularis]|uniref:carbonic anhydrase-related protein 10 isoform X2 n=1 Tax=Chelonus insularis TaxID=460826 RepID=UPI0015887A63|nr:carbonic anhydrase-related protein 10-like isoform X2 [Chelonus insularis]